MLAGKPNKQSLGVRNKNNMVNSVKSFAEINYEASDIIICF